MLATTQALEKTLERFRELVPPLNLTEPECLNLLQEVGIRTPHFHFLQEIDSLPDLAKFPGDSVVLKIVSRTIIHKRDVGGVALVQRDADALRKEMLEMAGRAPRTAVEGFLIVEYVPYRPTWGTEVLLSFRWTDDFGPVWTVAPGGTHAETLSRQLRRDSDYLVLSSELDSDPSGRLAGLALFSPAPARLGGPDSHGTVEAGGTEALGKLLQQLVSLSPELAATGLSELEINPLVFYQNGWTPLDAFGRIRKPTKTTSPRPLDRIACLLHPRSVAVVGVSKRRNPGRTILENTLRAGFDPQALTIVKPGCQELLGCRCLPDLDGLESPVDLLVIAIPAEAACQMAIQAISTSAANSIILIPSGFDDSDNSDLSQQIRSALESQQASTGMRTVVNGENCMGLRSAPAHLDTLFIPGTKLHLPRGAPDPVALISQSGAFAVTILSQMKSLHPRYAITLGNQVDLTVADYMTFLQDEQQVTTFSVYVEGFKGDDGIAFLKAARQIRAREGTVILYRAGRTPEGKSAAASHTASICGDFEISRRLCRSAGVIVADELEDLMDLTRLSVTLRGRDPRGKRLAVVSNAGFECVLAADSKDTFSLADFTAETSSLLKETIRSRGLESIIHVRNPIDLTPMVDDSLFEELVKIILSDPGVDAAVVGCVPLSPSLQTDTDEEQRAGTSEGPGIARRLASVFKKGDKPWVCVVNGGKDFDRMRATLEEAGLPVFRTADRATRMLSIYCSNRIGS
jgi:acyl-CoA synthetase (NDP forming)